MRDCLFLGDSENEANVDAIGLDRVFTGIVSSGENVSDYADLLK